MSPDTRFRLVLAVGVLLSLSIKLLAIGGIENPHPGDVAATAESSLVAQGFASAGITEYAGRPSLLVNRGACLLYLIPVAPQGYNEATLSAKLAPGERLSFVFRGELYRDRQPRWAPLVNYYVSKAIRYSGWPARFWPVYGVVEVGDCARTTVEWSQLPAVAFRRHGLDGFKDKSALAH